MEKITQCKKPVMFCGQQCAEVDANKNSMLHTNCFNLNY